MLNAADSAPPSNEERMLHARASATPDDFSESDPQATSTLRTVGFTVLVEALAMVREKRLAISPRYGLDTLTRAAMRS
jgi:hypothetical protein